MRLNTILFFVIFSFLLASSPDKAPSSYPQSQTTGSIEGTVTGPDGGLVAGATVTATNKQTGKTVGTQTDSEGRFSLKGLPPGRYRVEVTSPGFQTFVVNDVSVNISGSSALNISFVDPVTDSIVGKIKGRVKNRRSGQSIHDAEITITQLSNEKTYGDIKTNSEGRYEKPGLVPDRYRVRAEASGFISQEKTVRLRVRQVKTVDFSLTPQ